VRRGLVKAAVPPAALLAGLGPLLAGCSGSSDGHRTDPRRTLAAAKRHLDDTSGVRVSLSTPTLPTGVDGLLRAEGVGTHAPAFRGTIKVGTQGITADADVVAVRRRVWAKLPFTVRFVAIDPTDYGAPDPAALLRPRHGLSSLLTAARQVRAGERVRSGRRVLSSYTGTVPGDAVADVLPSASTTGRFRATFTVDDRGRLARAVLRGPFYPHADDVTYTIGFDHYGTSATITAP